MEPPHWYSTTNGWSWLKAIMSGSKQVMLLKTLDRKLFTYRPYERVEGKE